MNTELAYKTLYNANCRFDENYKLLFLTQDRYNKIESCLSYLRKYKEINGDEYYVLHNIFKHYYDNYYKIKNLERLEPRKIAQRFIGRKKIREFILKRDNYKCLRCGSSERLSLDHIVPIHFDGENKLSNLQTLCKSCNSWKGTNIIDYR